MKIIECAIVYPTKEPYAGDVKGISKGELYVASNHSHSSMTRYVFKMHPEESNPMDRAIYGYLATTDVGVIFIDRLGAASAENVDQHVREVYSYDVLWDKNPTSAELDIVQHAKNKMWDMFIIKGVADDL